MLLPERVVEFATPKNSPLHSYFEWDQREAAHKYRIDQARSLIRTVMVTMEDRPNVHMRAYVSLPTDRLHGTGYRRIDDVLSNKFLRKQLAEEMTKQADAWRTRAELIGVTFDPAPIKKAARAIRSAK
jgi:hypothetical protein